MGEPGGRGFSNRKEDFCPGSGRSQDGKYLLMSHWGIKNLDISPKSGGVMMLLVKKGQWRPYGKSLPTRGPGSSGILGGGQRFEMDKKAALLRLSSRARGILHLVYLYIYKKYT